MIEKFRRSGPRGWAAGVLLLVMLASTARAENHYLSKAIQSYENFE